jgi:spore maturation protein CgeB
LTAPLTVAYHNPYPTTIYAARYVTRGFVGALRQLGHTVVELTPGTDLRRFLVEHRPDVLVTASHFLYRKALDYELLREWRRANGLVVLTKIDFWSSPIDRMRINEAPSMKDDAEVKRLLGAGLLGDRYFHVAAQGDPRMEGFEAFAGQGYATIPLAADSHTLMPEVDERFAAEISFIGTNLPQKRRYLDEWLRPLGDRHDLRIYGQDWTRRERWLGRVTKAGQYFNAPVIRQLQSPPLEAGDEARIYASSKVLVNLHEDYQRTFGGDCNERTFKIPFCGGLEICDDVACVRDYFVDGEEIVIATSRDDWFEKVDHYLSHPDEAKAIGEAGRRRALADHTYDHRAQELLALATR